MLLSHWNLGNYLLQQVVLLYTDVLKIYLKMILGIKYKSTIIKKIVKFGFFHPFFPSHISNVTRPSPGYGKNNILHYVIIEVKGNESLSTRMPRKMENEGDVSII